MKKILIVFLSVVSMFIFSACNSGPEYVNAEDSRAYASMGLDYHDIESVVEKSVASLLSSGYVQAIKQPKVLVISDIINDTMQNVDVEQLSRKVTRDMRNSGKFKLSLAISGSGTSGDKMIDSVRAKTRGNDEFFHPEVVAVNKFRRMMHGEAETLYFSSDSKVAEVCRGKKGAAIVNVSGEEVALSIKTSLPNGKYQDAVYGTQFTVKGGNLTGTVKPYTSYILVKD